MLEFAQKNSTVIGFIIVVAISIYIYRELQKTKQEVKDCKMFSVGIANRLSQPLVDDAPKTETTAKEVKEEVKAED